MKKTEGLIPEIIDNISPDVVMYLINAIYFKGVWKYEFDPEKTSERDFYLEDSRSMKVDMMEMEEEVLYTSNDIFRQCRYLMVMASSICLLCFLQRRKQRRILSQN